MCGICGILNLGGAPASESIVVAMAGALTHRGPDESGVYIHGGIGLGHTRLKIIDLSRAAQQPMGNEDGSIRIVFNGEIYNYRALRAGLRAAGHIFRSHSDTEVILHLYEEKGDRCVEDLDGMFAFAIWDARRRRMLLARDRVGKKPLFYYRDSKVFAFASEIKALLRHPSIPIEIDRAQVPRYFLYGYVPAPSTFYQGISALPPGYALAITPEGGFRSWQYWDLQFPINGVSDPSLADDGKVARCVKDLVVEAVRKRVFADVPLGAFLSGGIDSSIVVGIMSRLMDNPVKTFSIGFAGDRAFDETSYARSAAKHFKTDHTEFVVEPRALDLIERLVWHHDGPFGDPSGIPTYIVSRLARDHVTVALTGDGGDELFAGYLRFPASIMAEKIHPFIARSGNRVFSMLPEPRNYHSLTRRAQRFFGSIGMPFYERFSRWISLFYDDLESLLGGELSPGWGEMDRIAYFRPHLEKVSRYTPLSKLLYLNAKTYLPDDLLVKMDRASMANGLEVRSPFLDRDLMEYAAALPDRMKLRRGSTKYILKRAFSDLLPRDILTRGKKGFGVPLGTWFRGELRDFMFDLLLSPDSRSRDYLNQGYVRRLAHEHQDAKRDHGHRLWAVITFEVWLRLLPQWAGKVSVPNCWVSSGSICH